MGTHQDEFAKETRHSRQEVVSKFTPFNSESTKDVSISTVNGRREVELQKPLFVALAKENKGDTDSDWSDQEGSVDAIFDEALCDVTELALQTVEAPTERVELYKLRALLIQLARGLNTYEDLADYIGQYSTAQLEQFGLRGPREQSTYRKAAKTLKTNGELQTVRDACFVAVHALFWNGVPVPETVLERYQLDYDAGPAATDFPDGARQLGLYNLVEDLIRIVVENLSLHREENKSRELRSILGIFAYAARHGESITDYERTAHHAFDLRSALSGSTIWTHLEGLHRWKVSEMFDDVNQALLKYVLGSGVVSEPVMVSYDLTDVQSLGIGTDDQPFKTEDGRWRFASLAFTDPDLDFSFGLRLLKSESQRARVLKNFLRSLTEIVEVKRFMLDRGFDGREDIEACHDFVPNDWVICAQDDSNSTGKNSDYARLRADLEPGGTTVQENAGYADLTPPVKLIGYSGADEQADTPEPVRAFYTAMEIPEEKSKRDELITKVNFQYNQRAKIEPVFRMAKNKFDLATDSDKPQVKAFYVQMSVLLHNLYTVVNAVPSPQAGVEIDTTQNELLEVTHNLALNGPTIPDALTYHRDHR